MGCAVPRRDFDAVVHSAFTHAVNLRLVRNKRLITLVPAEEADLPQGIRLSTQAWFTFEDWGHGESVVCRDGMLWYEAKKIKIDLRHAKRWTCDLAAHEIRIADPETLAAWTTVIKVLGDRWKKEEDPNLAGQTAAIAEIQKNAVELADAARRDDSVASRNAAAKLIGLGPGLTPAGDDFLVGFLAGLWSTAGGNHEHKGLLAGFARDVIRLSRRTNDISRAYLFHAAHGQVSSRLADLAAAIGEAESPKRLREVAKVSMQVGHFSGTAATAGLLVGLSVWNVPPSSLADIKALLAQHP